MPVRDVVIGAPTSFDSNEDSREDVLVLDDVHQIVRTDVDGRFELAAKFKGGTLITSAPGFGPVLFDRAWLGTTRDAELVIPIAPAAQFTARVIGHTGTPPVDFELHLRAFADNAMRPTGMLERSEVTSKAGFTRRMAEHGSATIETVPAMVPFVVELWSNSRLMWREPGTVVFEPGQLIEKEWRLGSGCRVSGKVIDQDSAGIAGQTIWLKGGGVASLGDDCRLFVPEDEERVSASTTTGHDGSFVIDDVQPGGWWLGVAPTRKRLEAPRPDEVTSVAEVLVVSPEQRAIDLTVHVHRGLFIRGTMVDPTGAPVAGHVSVGTNTKLSAPAFDDGVFSLGPLAPGEYEVIGAPWASSLTDRAALLSPSSPIRVAAGSDRVILTVNPGGAVSVDAVRADDDTRVRAEFILTSESDPKSIQSVSGWSGPTRSGDFVCLRPGTYSVVATTSDGCCGCERGLVVMAGQILEGVRVGVEPGAKLSLHFNATTPEYASVDLWSGSACLASDGIPRGTIRAFVVPHGIVTVRWRADLKRFEEEVLLAAGETRELVWPREK